MPLATPTVLLGFLLLWTWGISSGLLQQSAAASPYLGRGVSPHCRPSWPWTWSSSSRPSCTRAATAPWTWGSSSQLLPLTSRCGVAPLSHASAWSVAAGTLLLCGPLHLSTTAITIRSVAERSYSPLPEVRGGGRECQASTATAQGWLRGATPCPRSEAAAGRSYPPAWGQGQQPGGATPRPRSGGCAGAGGPRGATPRSRSGRAAVRRYPSSKVRRSGCALLEQPWRDTPRPTWEKPK